MIHDNMKMRSSPNLGAVAKVLWSLVRSDDFETPKPDFDGLAYREQGFRGIPPLADVYLPSDRAGKLPSVVLVHGGGFFIGSRRMKPVRVLLPYLLDAGFAVCSLDYRLIFRGGRFPESYRDVVDGWTWWHGQCERWSLDPGRISLLGISAGGTLALRAASDPQCPAPHTMISVFGIYDFQHMKGLSGWLPRLLFQKGDGAERRVYSLLAEKQVQVPTLLLHGDADRLVPVSLAEKYAAIRREQGLPTALHVYPNAPHGFFNENSAVSAQAGKDLLRFLRDYR